MPRGEPSPLIATTDRSATFSVPCSSGTITTRLLPVSEMYRLPAPSRATAVGLSRPLETTVVGAKVPAASSITALLA